MARTIILDGARFDYTDTELAKIKTYWSEYSKHSNNTVGKVKQIAKDLRMTVDDTFLVILHLQREGKI